MRQLLARAATTAGDAPADVLPATGATEVFALGGLAVFLIILGFLLFWGGSPKNE